MSIKKILPYDYDTAQTTANWRERLVWPLVNHDLNDVVKAQSHRYLALVENCASEQTQNTLLLTSWVMGRIRALTVAAYTCDAAQRAGIAFCSIYPEIQCLTGQVRESDVRAPVTGRDLTMPPPTWSVARRVARVFSWTGLREVPSALLRPGVTAVSHNAVLRDVANSARRPVGFIHAETILRRAVRQGGFRRDDGCAADIAEMLAAALAGAENHPGLDSALAWKLEALARPLCFEAVRESRGALAGLERARQMPASIWSGTGGNYAARAVGLEVLRRGGEVTRFSHSAASGLLDSADMEAITELSVSSRFVTATRWLADNLVAGSGRELTKGFREPRIDAHTGDPSFRQVPRGCMCTRSQPWVVYATTILAGERQYSLPLLPDLVYLDWQGRLIEMLQTLPIELTFKPHPGGLLKGRAHPLSETVDTCCKPFEALLGHASILVIDYAATTAFWKALCSDAIVVWIDLGQVALSDSVRALVHRRCRVIPATYNGDGKPVIEPEALEEALFRERSDCERPEPFRHILGGQA